MLAGIKLKVNSFFKMELRSALQYSEKQIGDIWKSVVIFCSLAFLLHFFSLSFFSSFNIQ